MWRAVREFLPALSLITVTDSLTFRATESHNQRSVGLVEGGEKILACITLITVTDSLTFRATESHNERSVGLVEGGERGLARLAPDNCQRSPYL